MNGYATSSACAGDPGAEGDCGAGDWRECGGLFVVQVSVRQAKPGRGGCHVGQAETSQWDPAGSSPARPRWATSRKRVLRGRKATHGQPWPRSVDSDHVGRVMEPRNELFVGADAVETAEGNTEATNRAMPAWPVAAVPPGSESRACMGGSSRNLGGPDASTGRWNRRAEREQGRAGAPGSRSAAVGARKRGNRPKGPRRAKGGTMQQTRTSARWERLRTHQPPWSACPDSGVALLAAGLTRVSALRRTRCMKSRMR